MKSIFYYSTQVDVLPYAIYSSRNARLHYFYWRSKTLPSKFAAWLAFNNKVFLPDIFVEQQQNHRCCGDSQLLWQEPSKITI